MSRATSLSPREALRRWNAHANAHAPDLATDNVTRTPHAWVTAPFGDYEIWMTLTLAPSDADCVTGGTVFLIATAHTSLDELLHAEHAARALVATFNPELTPDQQTGVVREFRWGDPSATRPSDMSGQVSRGGVTYVSTVIGDVSPFGTPVVHAVLTATETARLNRVGGAA